MTTQHTEPTQEVMVMNRGLGLLMDYQLRMIQASNKSGAYDDQLHEHRYLQLRQIAQERGLSTSQLDEKFVKLTKRLTSADDAAKLFFGGAQ